MKKDPLKDLPELTAGSRGSIWRVAEQARLRLLPIQRECFVADPFRSDSGGRYLNADLATSASIEYAQAYFHAIAMKYLRLNRPYRRLNQLLTAAMKLVYTETDARWTSLDFGDRMSLESAILPKVGAALRDKKDQLLVESLREQKPNERPKRGDLPKAPSSEDRSTRGPGPTPTSPLPEVALGSMHIAGTTNFDEEYPLDGEPKSFHAAPPSSSGPQNSGNSRSSDVVSIKQARAATVVKIDFGVQRPQATGARRRTGCSQEPPNSAAARAAPVTEPVDGLAKKATEQHANVTDLSTKSHVVGSYGGAQANTTSEGRRHGFPADMQRHLAIAEIVSRYAKHWEAAGPKRWARDPALKSICTDLDQAEIEIPQNWANGKPSPKGKKQSRTGGLLPHNAAGTRATPDIVKLKGWSDAIALGYKRLVVDQIRYSLGLVINHRRQAPAET
jgi:hypothetical protein